jgi:putative transposase
MRENFTYGLTRGRWKRAAGLLDRDTHPKGEKRPGVAGPYALPRHCSTLQKRNILDHLPPTRKAYVSRMLTEVWRSDCATRARRRLKTLLQWLESNGENGAAGSLREGMEETLTVAKLDLPGALRTFLVTTNAIENLIGTSRRISRKVKRWRSGEMIVRWTAIGLAQAEKNFRRVSWLPPSAITRPRPAPRCCKD